MDAYRAQGATEYLVLLAVVLIVALVSVALLGFFPGMASDARIAQSQSYWQAATPIAVVESAAGSQIGGSGYTYPYIRMRNVGAYPIRITAMLGGDGEAASIFYGTNCGIASASVNFSDYFYLAPGEEKYISYSPFFNTPCNWYIRATTDSTTTLRIGRASTVCQNSSTAPGTLIMKNFGFEYVQYIDGQQTTKRQIGKDLIMKCSPPV